MWYESEWGGSSAWRTPTGAGELMAQGAWAGSVAVGAGLGTDLWWVPPAVAVMRFSLGSSWAEDRAGSGKRTQRMPSSDSQ